MNFIDKLREENGYTYLDLSKMLKCSKSYIWQLFNKKRNLSYEHAILIASIFNMKPDEIFYSDFIDNEIDIKIKETKRIKEKIDKNKQKKNQTLSICTNKKNNV